MGCMNMYDDQLDTCPYCGYQFDTPPELPFHLEPGSILEQRYVVGRALGFGGFSVTYIGYDFLMERKVAIKEYFPGEFATRMPNQKNVTVYSGDREEQFNEGLQKTLDEARRLARFESVPGIVQIYDCFEENGTSYIVMEYLEGMTLDSYIDEHGKMPVDQALSVTLQIAEAMQAVHKTEILHRNIAPDNIFVLNPDDPDHLQVKLFDFGAARYATTKHSKSLSVLIEEGYSPEEQYRSRGDQGPWTDVYALAATMYKMITGITPQGAMERSVKDELKKPSKLGVKISKPMETALMNALNVKIQDRTQTMQDFADELMAAEVKERKITKTRNDVGAIPRWVFGLAGGVIALVAVLAVLILTGIIPVGIGWGHSELESYMARVPNVVNQDADEAETLLAVEGLGMNRERAAYSEEVPANLISYQEIPAGSVVEKETPVMVWISLGERTGVIPALTGRQREDAIKLLNDAGFENVKVIEDPDAEGAYNSVLSVSEDTGASVVLSQTVTLTVCMNEAAGLESGELSEVPDVTGVTDEEAQTLLADAGFRVNRTEEYSTTIAEGMVIRQSPKAGNAAMVDSYVDITVSLGVEKVFLDLENVLYMVQADAEEAIEAQGFVLGSSVREYSDSVSSGSVIRVVDENGNTLSNNAELEAGSAVRLVISRGSDPAKQTTAAPATTRAQSTQPAATTAPAATTRAPQTTAYTPPATTAYVAPETTAYTPPATTAYVPPETTAYTPPATTAYVPPATTAAAANPGIGGAPAMIDDGGMGNW